MDIIIVQLLFEQTSVRIVMRIFGLLLITASLLLAKIHTVRLDPFEIYHIKSAVAAQVQSADDSMEGKMSKGRLVVHLDDRLDRKNLRITLDKLQTLEKIVAITKESLKNAKSTMELKRKNYQRIAKLPTKSNYEKDMRKAEYLLAKNSYLGIKEKLNNLLMQRLDLLQLKAKYEDIIEKKNIRPSGYITKVYPRANDVVVLGSPLVDVADISKARAVLYLTPEEIEGIEKKKIYINGKPTSYRFSKLIETTDPNYITQYRAELILPAPKIFGKFIEVEIK